MERKDSLGKMTKMPRLSAGSMQRFKSRGSQSSVGSIADVFASEATKEGRSDLLVRKLRNEKNLIGDKGPNAESGTANVTPLDPFEEGEQTLFRPNRHQHGDLDVSGYVSDRERVKGPEKISERSETNAGEELLFTKTSSLEIESDSRRKEQSSLPRGSGTR